MERYGWECDYIISHCAPSSIQAVLSLGEYKPDELTKYLEEIHRKCHYRTWFFGHYHRDEQVDERHRLLYHEILRIV